MGNGSGSGSGSNHMASGSGKSNVGSGPIIASGNANDIDSVWAQLENGLENEVLANKVAGITYARYMELYE